MQFAKNAGLGQAVCHIEHAGDEGGINLVLVFGVGSHGGDVLAGLDQCCGQDRLGCRGGGDDDTRAGHRLGHGCGGGDRKSQTGGHRISQTLCAGHVARPDPGGAQGPHQRQRLKLHCGLHPGAKDRHDIRVLPCKVARSDRPRRRRAHVGQIAVVQQQRLDKPGAGRQHHHHAIGRWQAKGGVAEETGADLDRKAVDPRHIGGFHIDLAAMLGKIKSQDRGHGDRQGGQRPKRAFDAFNAGQIKRHQQAQIGLGQNGDRGSHANSSALLAPAITRACKSGSIFCPDRIATTGPEATTLPARMAPIPTAAAPSMTSPIW